MELEVVGRHALLFDDDAMAAFVDSPDALIEWHSLSIDRYDVRHLLTAPPPPRTRRRRQSSPLRHPDSALEPELDHERYLDLPPAPDDEGIKSETTSANEGGFHTVGFSYGNAEEPIDQKTDDADSGFQPSFPVPDELLHKLPPTEKLHQIIARTAIFVSKNGGQSEIVLRVKQGDNPTFGFLMPDHHLHPYFRFLVDHQELLKSDTEEKSSVEHAGGALSLLGTVYGSGEDEENTAEDSPWKSKSEDAKDGIGVSFSNGSDPTVPSAKSPAKEETVSKHPISSLKEKSFLIKKNRSICTVNAVSECGLKKDGGASSVSTSSEKKRSSSLPTPLIAERSIVEPPSEMKRLMDKIVEFILKNGRQFESNLVEQDKDLGRFPFLQPSNQYHLYYLKALETAEQSKLPGKKSDMSILGVEKKSTLSKESDSLSLGSDMPDELNKKEKFKMVLPRTKKDEQEQPSKEPREEIGVRVDADAAAAILQAVRRGIKYPNLPILSRAQSLNGGESRSTESSQPVAGPLPPVTLIAKTAAAATASEADSSEAGLTMEQKMKAERLKRAKMFTAMLKSGAVSSKASATESVVSGLSAETEPSRDRDGSSVPPDPDATERNERRLKRSYRSRRTKQDADDGGEEEKGRDGDGEDEERDHKYSRKKKRRSHRSSHDSKERDSNYRKKHSSSSLKDKESRHRRHRHNDDTDSSSDDDEHRHRRHSRHRHDDDRDSSSDGEEHRHGRRRHRRRRKHRSSDDGSDGEDEHHRRKSRRRHTRDRTKRDDLEEGDTKPSSGEFKAQTRTDRVHAREASVDAPSSSQRASETTEVPDDLRAKIRAMLMATM